MSNEEKKKIGQRLTTRVETALHFIELDYLARHPQPDVAWIRNFYILFSFYTELLLKAILVMSRNFVDIPDLDKKLRKGGHDLEAVGRQIGRDKLLEFGIKNITFSNREYLVETAHGNFSVKDFNDIRYDFLDGRVRTLNGNEHELFKKQIEVMREINKKIKLLVW